MTTGASSYKVQNVEKEKKKNRSIYHVFKINLHTSVLLYKHASELFLAGTQQLGNTEHDLCLD